MKKLTEEASGVVRLRGEKREVSMQVAFSTPTTMRMFPFVAAFRSNFFLFLKVLNAAK